MDTTPSQHWACGSEIGSDLIRTGVILIFISGRGASPGPSSQAIHSDLLKLEEGAGGAGTVGVGVGAGGPSAMSERMASISASSAAISAACVARWVDMSR
jgi:hypothetical protein